jgi:hypothetical protein
MLYIRRFEKSAESDANIRAVLMRQALVEENSELVQNSLPVQLSLPA